MRYLTNQRGYILLIVLMVVIVFSVLGISLLSLNQGAAKQFNNKEESVQARHAAEMGALHFKSEVTKEWTKTNSEINVLINDFNRNAVKTSTLVTNINKNIAQKNNEFCDKIKNFGFNEPQLYQLKPLNNEISCNSIPSKRTEWNFKLKSSSLLDTVNTKPASVIAETKLKTYEYSITVNGANVVSDLKHPDLPLDLSGQVSTIDTNLKYYANSISVKDLSVSTKDVIFAKDLFVTNSLNMQPHSCISVKGDFTVLKSVNLKSKAVIFIYGNANLPSSLNYHSNHGGIYVAGKVFIDGKLQNPKPYFDENIKGTIDGCAVPPNFEILNPEEKIAVPELVVTYN
ncbi:type II secretion system protein [Paenisporosarcina indica]|uniref:type II secretion system protein n=1 Tax=Paenisporosarcina indica TaxID=650093 RepID=UPI00094FD6ED|nr:type II secretion system protein [Paenisporosarcina indica]